MRPILLTCGVVTLAVVWLGPLPQLARHSFAAHMTMHMAVVAVAAPLLSVGIAGGRLDPIRYAPGLFAPIPASVIELMVVWAWHAPALHHMARQNVPVLVIEQGMFLLSGFLVWMSACGRDAVHHQNRIATGVVGLLLTSMHMTLLGALLALAPRLLYVHSDRYSEFISLEDQQLGGALMLLVGGVSYLCGGLCLMVGLLRGPDHVSEGRA